MAGLRICPLHSQLPVEFYQRVFDEPPAGTRKLVVATNIAETSITVPGIKYVIDCGAVKQKVFNAESGMESLNIMPISKPAAKQRAGRAGRTGPGVAIRLYSEKRMDKEFPAETVPEILRTNLSSTILTLKGMGIKDPVTFDPTRTHAHTHTHSLTHALTHSLTHSRTHARTHARAHVRVCARTHALTHSLTHPPAHLPA